MNDKDKEPFVIKQSPVNLLESNSNPTTSSSATNDTVIILVNSKLKSLFKELIKNYLVMLDNWPHPLTTEVYNQVNKSKQTLFEI